MMTIYLIRHGQKQSHVGDPQLTDIGIIQAQETGKFLNQFPIDKIVSSPLKRTVETAQHIASQIGLKYSLHDSLVERMHRSDFSITHQEFAQEWNRATNNRKYIPKYGDSSFTTGQRVENCIKEVANKNEHIVLVTHGGAILDYLRNMFGDARLSSIKAIYQEGEDYQMMNCAINIVILNDKPVLKMLNFTEHLTTKSE